MNSKLSKNPLFLTTVIALPVLFWLFVILKYAANIPWFDDFDPFADFLRSWIESDGFLQRIKFIFQPNNEHRMIWGKLITLGYYQLTGELNFRFIQISAAFFTLGVLFIFWKSFRAIHIPIIYFLPITFFIFHLQYYGTYLWAICGMQHQPVIFFVALTSWLLGKGRFGAGVVAAVCANFAMGNGILVWTSGFAILLFLGKNRQLLIWCVFAAINIFLYFFGMSPQGNESSFEFFLAHPHLTLIGFFTYLGGLFDLIPDRHIDIRNIPTFVGGFIVGVYVIWWVLRTVFAKPFISHGSSELKAAKGFVIGMLVFILANAAVIGLLRPRFGMDVMLVSNYKIYPGVFFAAAYFSLLLFRKKPALIWKGGLSLSLLLWIGTLFNYLPTVLDRSRYFEINTYNQRYNQFGLGFVPGSDAAAYIDKLIQYLEGKGIYKLPDSIGPLVRRMQSTPPSAVRIEHKVINGDEKVSILIPELETRALANPLRFLSVSSGGRNYVFKVDPNLNRGRNPFKKFEKGASVSLSKKNFEKGVYEVLFYDEANGQHYLFDTFEIN